MQQTNTKLWVRFVPLLLILSLIIAACGETNNDPDVSLRASTNSPDVGDTVTLTATPDNFDGTVSYQFDITAPTGSSASLSGSGASRTFAPDVAGDYSVTVTATSGTQSATDTEEIEAMDGGDTDPPTGGDTGGPVTGGPGDDEDTAEPTGTFAVSLTEDGTYVNDSPGDVGSDADPRVLSVAAGGSFFAQAEYEDPEGVSDIEVLLVNASPAGIRGALGSTDDGGTSEFFIESGPEGDDCTLDGTETEVTCFFQIGVGDSTVEIETLEGAGNEFAYVFRARVTDGNGNVTQNTSNGQRGYIDIE